MNMHIAFITLLAFTALTKMQLVHQMQLVQSAIHNLEYEYRTPLHISQ